jgi:hypothetical protein
MKRQLRLASFLIALTFQGAALTDALGLHACPVHDALPGSTTADGHEHEGASHASGHHQHGDTHEGQEGPCACVGMCLDGASVPSAPVFIPTFEASYSQVAPTAAAWVELPSSPAFLLPYSHGPPLTA